MKLRAKREKCQNASPGCSRTRLDDKARLQEAMRAIGDAYAMLALQWTALGQSPDHGVALLARVQARHPDVPFVFYSRKITPEDVIRVLQAGAVDAVRKGALNNEQVLARRATAQEIYRRKSVHSVANVNVTLYVHGFQLPTHSSLFGRAPIDADSQTDESA